jgi:sugar O-acyltransferase (sialic acid O-acetyltransferase NeuD family)
MQPVYIFGAGGLARCCGDALKAQNRSYQLIEAGQEASVPKGAIQAIVAIGDNFKRCEIIKSLKSQFSAIQFVNAIHPSVIMGERVQLGEGNYVGAGSILGPDVKLGSYCVINAGVVIEHDSKIGDYVNIGTGSCFGGNLTLNDRAIVGVGVSGIHGLTVGEDALLGSGAVICADVPPNALMLGIPAKQRSLRKFGEVFL